MIAIAGHQDGREGTRISRRALIGLFGMARDLEIKEGKVFQIDDHDLKDCK